MNDKPTDSDPVLVRLACALTGLFTFKQISKLEKDIATLVRNTKIIERCAQLVDRVLEKLHCKGHGFADWLLAALNRIPPLRTRILARDAATTRAMADRLLGDVVGKVARVALLLAMLYAAFCTIDTFATARTDPPHGTDTTAPSGILTRRDPLP